MPVVLVLMKDQISSTRNQSTATVSSLVVAQDMHKLLTAIVQVQELELWEWMPPNQSMASSSWKPTQPLLSLVDKFLNHKLMNE